MKKAWVLSIVAILSLFGNSQFIQAKDQDFPNRTIEMIVPFEPGGTVDLATRIVMDQLAKELKVPVAVINKPGATGTRGTDTVAKAKPDGHTLLAGTLATMVMVHFFMDNVSYDANRDFLPLGYAGESPSLLVVKSTSPWKTLKEMVDYAKANPGKLSYAAAGGLASTSSMNMELIKSREGVDIASVIYEGGGPAIVSVIGGHVHMTSAAYPALRSHIMAGTLRPLATSKKVDELPDVPTFKEVGFPEVLINWTAFFAPAKAPKDVYKKLVEAFDKVLENPETVGKLKKGGYAPERISPAEISALIKQQFDLVSRIVKGKTVK